MSNRTCRSAASATGAVILMLALSAAAAPPSYTATRIAVPGGYGIGINSRGDVVGVWRNGYESYLVSSQGSVDQFSWVAAAINDSGQIAGHGTSQDGGRRHAFVRIDGSVRDIHPAAAEESFAKGINASGTVVGYYTVEGAARGFVFEADRHETLASLSDSLMIPVAINSSGQITGDLYVAHGPPRAFLYTAGEMKDLGTLGGSYSKAAALNRHGHVVGYSRTSSGVHHAFVHAGGQMSSLGTLGNDLQSFANGINDAGQIVGDSGDGWEVSHPFLHVDGAMHDLNVLVVSGLDGTLLSAVAINAAGQILTVGCGQYDCGTYRLDPLTSGKARATEYHHAEFDHYFMTTNAAEIAKLDAYGTGWVRTGEWLDVDAAAQPATSPVCRFFSASFAPRSSHFYTPDPGECETVKRSAAWQFEGEAFHVVRADASGVCPAGKQAVYRLYNSGIGGAPNHRYTASRSVRDATIVKGWIPEGYGPLGVGMCV